MARARAKQGRRVSEISEVILAEWYRVLPESKGDKVGEMDAYSLAAAFREILELTVVEVIIDYKEEDKIKVVVPRPPVESKSELDTYIRNNGDFLPGMGAAVIFGCGR